MFIGRRRPLARAAMIGGTAYVAGRAGQRAAYREQERADHEDYQEQRIAELEAQQQQPQYAPPPPQYAPPPPPPAAPTQAAPTTDVVGKLTELKQLLDSGVLTQDEFDAAKRQLLGS